MSWVCRLDSVQVVRGGVPILDDVSVVLGARDKVGMLGPNGAGKSTMLRLIAGLERPSAGTAQLAPGASVGILLQEPVLDETKTVLGTVEDGAADTKALLGRFTDVTARLAEDDSPRLLDELGRLQQELDRRDAWDLNSRLAQAMEALRCPLPDAEIASLSGGERRRVALCQLLLQEPDLLLLDEPTNHLDADSVTWLEDHLRSYRGAVLAVTHDRYFLDTLAASILELDRGRLYAYQGNYSTYLATKQTRLKGEGKRDEKRRRLLQQELDWLRSGMRGGRRKASVRLTRYEEMAAGADEVRALDFDEIYIPPGPRLGTQVIEARSVTKGFTGRPLFRDLSFTLPRNGIVGVLGPNGVGKTTLFRMLVGQETPDSGEIRVGDSVLTSYADQNRAGMNAGRTAWELISGGRDVVRVGRVDIPSRAYLAAFGIKGTAQQKRVGAFSGGERNRLNLALTLRQGGNLLLLDEPTNDLDTETLASLERALLEFPGCVMVTAHDRWFLDRVATHILAWEGTRADPGRWFWFEGNFAEYDENRADCFERSRETSGRSAHRKFARS